MCEPAASPAVLVPVAAGALVAGAVADVLVMTEWFILAGVTVAAVAMVVMAVRAVRRPKWTIVVPGAGGTNVPPARLAIAPPRLAIEAPRRKMDDSSINARERVNA